MMRGSEFGLGLVCENTDVTSVYVFSTPPFLYVCVFRVLASAQSIVVQVQLLFLKSYIEFDSRPLGQVTIREINGIAVLTKNRCITKLIVGCMPPV